MKPETHQQFTEAFGDPGDVATTFIVMVLGLIVFALCYVVLRAKKELNEERIEGDDVVGAGVRMLILLMIFMILLQF